MWAKASRQIMLLYSTRIRQYSQGNAITLSGQRKQEDYKHREAKACFSYSSNEVWARIQPCIVAATCRRGATSRRSTHLITFSYLYQQQIMLDWLEVSVAYKLNTGTLSGAVRAQFIVDHVTIIHYEQLN